MTTLLLNTLVNLLLPPILFLVTGAIGCALWRRRPRLSRNLIFTSLALLWLTSSAAFNGPLLEALGWPAPADLRQASGAQAIVVLGGGMRHAALEYGAAATVNARTLERVRYAAWLSRQTGLPVLASGGHPNAAPAAEAEMMKSVLENEFSTPVRWIEVESKNTFENARASARILREAGIGKVFLVTHSFHMRRAVQAFAPTGIEVIPAPTGLSPSGPLTPVDFLPSPPGFQTSYFIAHELVGRVWYAIRMRFEKQP